MSETPNHIEKKVVLRAPHERVWRAISSADEFGTWFGMAFDGPFVAGAEITGRLVPTKVDARVATSQESFAGMPFGFTVDRIEPMSIFSFRWHPHAIDPKADYSHEPMTLVTFELEEVAGGTQVTITESGFDEIPLERRATAFASNDGGWTEEAMLLEKYVTTYATR